MTNFSTYLLTISQAETHLGRECTECDDVR